MAKNFDADFYVTCATVIPALPAAPNSGSSGRPASETPAFDSGGCPGPDSFRIIGVSRDRLGQPLLSNAYTSLGRRQMLAHFFGGLIG